MYPVSSTFTIPVSPRFTKSFFCFCRSAISRNVLIVIINKLPESEVQHFYGRAIRNRRKSEKFCHISNPYCLKVKNAFDLIALDSVLVNQTHCPLVLCTIWSRYRHDLNLSWPGKTMRAPYVIVTRGLTWSFSKDFSADCLFYNFHSRIQLWMSGKEVNESLIAQRV